MTLEELKKRNEELEQELALERKKVSDQNSYITKLEAAKKEAPNEGRGTDPMLEKYVISKIREEVMEKSISLIKNDISEAEYAAIEPDFKAFLDKNMKKENTTVDYVLDAFALVWGRSLRNKEHAIHKVKASSPEGTTPTPGQPTPTKTPITANPSQPPGITDTDGGGTPPPDQGVKVNNTKDAFKSLKQRMGNIGGNRFS